MAGSGADWTLCRLLKDGLSRVGSHLVSRSGSGAALCFLRKGRSVPISSSVIPDQLEK